MEIWGGVECTINRIGHRFADQCARSGHWRRPGDLPRFADLGLRKLRFPCLWETVIEHGWDLLETRLFACRAHGMQPIAGLLHHGSGPRGTSLIDPYFPLKFSRYARAFAERFPWIEDYTPVNEPLSTARFSCLYGHWYPHRVDDGSFVRALFQQVRATVLAMREIREVNPVARLIQTEDLGFAQSTGPVREQAEFENHRRWLTWDLLCGTVNRAHPLYTYLVRAGLEPDELAWLADNACPPDVIGINHYLLSDRFLDHRLELYPPGSHGGNGRLAYADVGVVDTGQGEPPAFSAQLMAAWRRYRIPLALTEVHTRGDEIARLQWAHELWECARDARGQGADIRAFTFWALLGAYDWNSLCTREHGFYEAGVFDMSAGEPRPSPLTDMIGALARKGHYEHPALERAGWWHSAQRVCFAPNFAEAGA